MIIYFVNVKCAHLYTEELHIYIHRRSVKIYTEEQAYKDLTNLDDDTQSLQLRTYFLINRLMREYECIYSAH